MLHRCDSRQRQYTELCNRSSSGGGSPQMERASPHMPSSLDTLEDYWEDASVSMRSQHSWEAPSSPWLGAVTLHSVISEEEENKKFTGSDLGSGSYQIRPHRHTFDVTEYLACMKPRRSFPPPLASCSTLSIKEGGRFVLKEMDLDRPHGFFRAQRGNGRLRLQLVLRDEGNAEDDEEKSASVDEGTVELSPEFFDEFGHVEHYVNDEGTAIRSNQILCDEDDILSNAIGVEGMDSNVCSTSQDVGTEVGYSTLQDVGSEVGCPTSPSQDVGVEVGCSTSDQSQVVAGLKDSKPECERILDFDGCFYEEPRRDNTNGRKEADFLEADNFLTLGKREFPNQAMASLSSWSPKQLCLHQSIVNMRPALGLAIS